MVATIKVHSDTKKLLDVVKKYDNQSYDEIIKEMVSDKVEEHLNLNSKLSKEILKLANEIKDKKVKTIKFEEAYKKLYG